MMTPEQEDHCNRIAARVSREIKTKYAEGQREHGGNLWEKFTPLQFARECLAEAIDQVIYLESQIELLERQEHDAKATRD